MTHDSYNTALKAAEDELAIATEEMSQAQARMQELGVRIADLRQTISVLSKLCGQQVIFSEDTLGLTDAVRKVFRDGCNRDFTAQDIRQQLQATGFPVSKYGNLLASIHVVVGRLRDKREIVQMNPIGSERPSYHWAFKMDSIPDVYGSGMRGDETPNVLPGKKK